MTDIDQDRLYEDYWLVMEQMLGVKVYWKMLKQDFGMHISK